MCVKRYLERKRKTTKINHAKTETDLTNESQVKDNDDKKDDITNQSQVKDNDNNIEDIDKAMDSSDSDSEGKREAVMTND
jgi:hypothetical protein